MSFTIVRLQEITSQTMPFFAIFVALPFLEIMIFMLVGDQVGLMNTLFMALLTAIIGGLIVQYQGLHTLAHIRVAINRGLLPLNELFDGICLVAAGALLITPGFLTDTIGFLLLIPLVRTGLRHLIKHHTGWEDLPETDPAYQSARRPRNGDIIDAEYERVDEESPQDRR